MASGGAQIAWGITRFLLGLVVWCLAGLFVFVLADGSMPLWAAITVSVLVMLGLPTLLTRLLIPAFARLGEKPRWAELWPGLCGVVALIALVAPPLFGRGFSARKLAEVSQHHRGAPPWIKRVTDTLGRWLAPSNSGPLTTHSDHRDGGVDADAARANDSGASADSSVDSSIEEASDVLVTDASDAESQDAILDEGATDDAGDAESQDAGDSAVESQPDAVALVADDAAIDDDGDGDDDSPDASSVAAQPLIDPNSSGSGLNEFASIDLGTVALHVWMGELALGGTDEVVVTTGDRVQVFYLQNDGIVERSVFAPRAPAGLTLGLARTLVADIDGDGRRDLGLCAVFSTERGGTRGGNVWWARARANGQFEAPRVLVSGGIDCAGIEFGDVNSDQRPELILVRKNNPYAPQPNLRDSELLWFTGQGSQWTQRGRVRLAMGAGGVWLDDVTRDGILDVIVHTSWEDRRNWVIAGARRGPSGVVNVEDVGTDEREFDQGQGRLDGDGRTDVVRIEQQTLRWYRTSSDGRPARTSASRALDFERFEF